MHMIDGFSVLKASSEILSNYNWRKYNNEIFVVDKEKIDELASDVRGIDYDDFVAFTTEALTGQGSESVYQLVDRENKTKQLLWKRKIPDTENSVLFNRIENLKAMSWKFNCLYFNENLA